MPVCRRQEPHGSEKAGNWGRTGKRSLEDMAEHATAGCVWMVEGFPVALSENANRLSMLDGHFQDEALLVSGRGTLGCLTKCDFALRNISPDREIGKAHGQQSTLRICSSSQTGCT